MKMLDEIWSLLYFDLSTQALRRNKLQTFLVYITYVLTKYKSAKSSGPNLIEAGEDWKQYILVQISIIYAFLWTRDSIIFSFYIFLIIFFENEHSSNSLDFNISYSKNNLISYFFSLKILVLYQPLSCSS